MVDESPIVMDPGATYRRLVPVDRLAPPVTPSVDVASVNWIKTTWKKAGA